MASRLCRLLATAAVAAPLATAAWADEGAVGYGETDPTGTAERKDFPNLLGGITGLSKGEDGKVVDEVKADELDIDALLKQRPQSMALLRSNGQGLVASRALDDYVNGLLERLIAASPAPDLPARAFVVASEGFSAAAYPDGSIFLTVSMLNDLEAEDELAFLLAHELSHVLLQHHGSEWLSNLQYNVLTSGKILLDVANQLSEATGKDLGNKKLAKAVLVTEAAYEVTDHALNPAWEVGQEVEADRLGLDIMVAAGFNPVGAQMFLDRLAVWEADVEARRAAEREAAEAAIAAKGEAIAKSSNVFMAAISTAKDAFSYGVDSVKQDLGVTHKSAEERIADYGVYVEREHLEAMAREVADIPWQKAKPDRLMTAVLKNYDQAFAARAALSNGDTKQAEKLVRKAISAPTKHHSYMRFLFYELRRGQNKPRLARTNLELALKGDEVSLPVFIALVEDEMNQSDYNGALSFLDMARERVGDAPVLVPYRIDLYRQTGKKKEMQSLLLQCQYEWPELAKRCRRAAGVTKEQDDANSHKQNLKPKELGGKSG